MSLNLFLFPPTNPAAHCHRQVRVFPKRNTWRQERPSPAGKEYRASPYLCDLVCDVVCAVDELAGRNDVHLPRGQSTEGVGLEVHEVERDLRDLADGAVAHEVRVRGRVQNVGLVVDRTCQQRKKQAVTHLVLLRQVEVCLLPTK